MLNRRMQIRSKAKQGGVTAVEFGIIAFAFFLFVLGIIEFGRIFYLYNTVQEVTRCAAREAAVYWKTEEESITQRCMFHAGSDGVLPFGWEIDNAQLEIRYLNTPGAASEATPDPDSPDGNISACQVNNTECIRYVEVTLSTCAGQTGCVPSAHRVAYQPLFGLVPVQGVVIPNSTVTMPAESLGFAR